MEEQQHTEILVELGKLETKIDGINNRLDISNGRLKDAERKIMSLEISRGEQKGQQKIIGIIIAFAASIVTLFLNNIVKR